MPAFIHIVAREQSNAVRDAVTGRPTDAQITRAFDYVQRGDMGGRSRTALNGGWTGVTSIARDAHATEAQRMWMLTDAQMASSGITNAATLQSFADRLATDVRARLAVEDTRPNVWADGLWTVAFAATTGTNAPAMPGTGGSTPVVGATPQAQATPTSKATVLLGLATVVGVMAWAAWPRDGKR